MQQELESSRVPSWRRAGPWLACAVIYAVAVAMHAPIVQAPLYGDEGVHYWTARYLGGRGDAVRTIWGHAGLGGPHFLLQRPLYAFAMWLPAQGGFLAFRTAASLAGAVMAPVSVGLLRAHGTRWPAAVLGGLAVATLPTFVVWGNVGLMDAPMTALVLGMLWAHARGRHALAAVLGVAACWTKETAILAVAILLAVEATVGLREILSLRRLLQLRPAVPRLAVALVVGAIPIAFWMVVNRGPPGGPPDGALRDLVERLALTPGLGVIALMGLGAKRSRWLAGAAVAGVAALSLLHVAGRGAPLWYDVPVQALVVVAVAASADALLAAGWEAGSWPATGALAVAVTAVVLVVACALYAGNDRQQMLRPGGSDAGNPFPQAWYFERHLRDRDYVRAAAAVPEERIAVLTVDIYGPRVVQPFLDEDSVAYTQDTGWSAWSLGPEMQPYARQATLDLATFLGRPGTWTLIEGRATPLNDALRDVYSDCMAYQDGRYSLLDGARCGDRGSELVAAAWPGWA
jgi:hypothetical protein